MLSRPAVEAGERLGFLPGDMKEKVDPYLRPLYDALYDMLPTEQVERRIASGEIEIAPGESVSLEPGGLHAMLMRLQRPMAKGESFSLTLDFSDGGEIVVEVPILGIAARGPES